MAAGSRIGLLQIFVVLNLFFRNNCVQLKPAIVTPRPSLINRGRSGSLRSCIPLFDVKYPRLHSSGSTPLLRTQNEEGCMNACIIDMRCVSYQIDTNPETTLCWLQLNKANLVLDNMIDLRSVTEYILVSRCSDPEAGQPTMNYDLCFPVFENKNPGWVSRKATTVSEAKTEDECKAACGTVLACVSYQMERKPNGILCWIQYDEKKLTKDQMHQSASISEHILVDRCPKLPASQSCIPWFDVKYPMTHSGGATPLPKTQNEEDCKKACVADVRCVSYQINTNPLNPFCLLQLNKTNLAFDNMLEIKSVTEHILVSRCSDPEASKKPIERDSSSCVPVFEKKQPGWVSRRATNVYDVKTEDDCKNTCATIPACVSYQIEKVSYGVVCRIQYDEQKLTKDQMYQSASISEYILVDRCQTSSENEEKECFVTMKPSMFGQLSANATPYAPAKEERACVAACIAKADCISVQFQFTDRNWLCFLQHNFHAFKPDNLMYHPNVTEYVITRRCEENNACSHGYPLKRLGGPMYFRRKRNVDCEVIIQLVHNGMSTTKTVPLKLESTPKEQDCITACAADKLCISTQLYFESPYGLVNCSMQYDNKAFQHKTLVRRSNTKEYIIKKRCDKMCPPSIIGRQSPAVGR